MQQPPKLLAEIPGFREAIAAASATDADRRDFAYLGLPRTVCGVRIKLMTLRQYIRLIQLSNPLIYDGIPDEMIRVEDVIQFLWILSPHYLNVLEDGLSEEEELERSKISAKRRRSFLKSIRTIRLGDAIREIKAYREEIFADKPPRSQSGIPVTSFAAVFVNIFAEAHGWSRDYILDSPLPLLYQELRRIILSANPKAAIVDRTTDKIKREFAARDDMERALLGSLVEQESVHASAEGSAS